MYDSTCTASYQRCIQRIARSDLVRNAETSGQPDTMTVVRPHQLRLFGHVVAKTVLLSDFNIHGWKGPDSRGLQNRPQTKYISLLGFIASGTRNLRIRALTVT